MLCFKPIGGFGVEVYTRENIKMMKNKEKRWIKEKRYYQDW